MQRKSSPNKCKSSMLSSKVVNYRKKKEMGQKQFRSSNDLFNDLINDNKSSIKKKTASVSSNSSTSSKTKSNHESHLSNDSGCYANIDRYSSPSDSSVLAEFKTRTLNQFKNDKTRNSLCDSVILSCSSSDSSINIEVSGESNKKAQLLCDQLNQILNLSSNYKSNVVESDQMTKQVNRSHTINSNEKTQRNLIKNLEDNKKSKISNLVKSSRKFFAWSPITTGQKTNDPAVFPKQNLKLNKKICDLIAAKLASESIELASVPFTDEMGFCKVPTALIKRYASDLCQDIEIISKCIENERLTQIEKSGKLGVNIFN